MRWIPLLLAATLVACGGAEPAGGVRGTVTAGPTCPVENVASPCPPAVWTGTVRATGTDGEVHETETADDGSFELPLEPGTYVVVAVTETGAPPTGIPADVIVPEGDAFVTADLAVDTGIR